jgi:diguanylate cyclase (GGDEF)-like protein
MIEKDFHITTEPLWYVPDHIRNRLMVDYKGDAEYTHFLLCGFYCLVAITFLIAFGIAAWVREEFSYAYTIFGFALTTVLIYGGIWILRAYHLANHLITILMGALCLFLFYSGGTENTGLLYYFIFPLVALFLQGTRTGVVSVIVLMLLTSLLQSSGIFGFDTGKYSDVLFIRMLSIYLIISILSFIFSYFRHRAEQALLIIEDDLRQLTFGDMETGVASRSLLDKLLHAEINRIKRYDSVCTILFVENDQSHGLIARFGTDYLEQMQKLYARVFTTRLRKQNIPGRWDSQRYMLLLPETPRAGAELLARRLLKEFPGNALNLRGTLVQPTVSIGGIQIRGDDEAWQVLGQADANLMQARANGGNQAIIS